MKAINDIIVGTLWQRATVFTLLLHIQKSNQSVLCKTSNMLSCNLKESVL